MKKSILVIVGLCSMVLLGAFFWMNSHGLLKSFNKELNNNQIGESIKNNDGVKKRLSDEDRAYQEHISYREAAIRNFYDFPDENLRRTVIDGKAFILVSYDETGVGRIPNRKDIFANAGGIIVFEKTKEGKYDLFWESKEAIVHAGSGFQDITNDGIPEIVVYDSPGASGSTTSFNVYAWRDNTFKLITPLSLDSTPTHRDTGIGGDNGETYMEDIDGDKIQEIVDGYIDDKNILHQRIFKYNGKEYYLWKEKTEPAK